VHSEMSHDERCETQCAIDVSLTGNAIVVVVHSPLHLDEQVACVDTSPRGNNAPTSSRPTTSPLAFLRAMKKAGATGFDAYAHHPYALNPSESPTTRPRARTAVSFGNVDDIIKVVTQLYGPK